MEHDPDCQSGIEDRADNRLVVHDAALAVGSCQTFRCPLHRSIGRRCRHDPSSGRGTEGRELQRGAFPPASCGSIFPVKTIRMVGIGLRLPDHEFRTRSLDPAVFVDRVAEAAIAADGPFAHAPERRHRAVDIVVDRHFAFGRMQPVQPAGILRERALPGDRHREKQRVETGVVEPLADIAPDGDQHPFFPVRDGVEPLRDLAAPAHTKTVAQQHDVAGEALQPAGKMVSMVPAFGENQRRAAGRHSAASTSARTADAAPGPAVVRPLPCARPEEAVRGDAAEKSTARIRDTSGPRRPSTVTQATVAPVSRISMPTESSAERGQKRSGAPSPGSRTA